MAKKVLPPAEALYPTPCVLVSCADRETKRHNIVTIAWCGVVCSQPPQVSISVRPSRYSHGMIKASGEFVVNIPTVDQITETDRCGIVSGRDTDKFAACRFTPEPASKVFAPLIKECPVNIECVVRSTHSLGAHDMFIGEVVAVHVDDAVAGPGGKPDIARARPITFDLGDYWSLAEKIGFYGFSAKK